MFGSRLQQNIAQQIKHDKEIIQNGQAASYQTIVMDRN